MSSILADDVRFGLCRCVWPDRAGCHSTLSKKARKPLRILDTHEKCEATAVSMTLPEGRTHLTGTLSRDGV